MELDNGGSCLLSYLRLGGWWFETRLGSKITRAKWTGGVAQAAELLLCKCDSLSQTLISQKMKEVQMADK
jgi:hypothetical protein